MFIRTILVLDDDATSKQILKARSREFSQDRVTTVLNEYNSPIFDLMNVSVDLGLYETCMNMIHRDQFYTKTQWKKLVWDAVWEKEDGDCSTIYRHNREAPLLFSVIEKPYYLIWWILSDSRPSLMKMCEKMTAIVTESSLLKANDVRLKNRSFWTKVCDKCTLGIKEDAKHLIMQCPYFDSKKKAMYDEIEQMQCEEVNTALGNAAEVLPILLGKQPDSVSIENMLNLCVISGRYISKMYDIIIKR